MVAGAGEENHQTVVTTARPTTIKSAGRLLRRQRRRFARAPSMRLHARSGHPVTDTTGHAKHVACGVHVWKPRSAATGRDDVPDSDGADELVIGRSPKCFRDGDLAVDARGPDGDRDAGSELLQDRCDDSECPPFVRRIFDLDVDVRERLADTRARHLTERRQQEIESILDLVARVRRTAEQVDVDAQGLRHGTIEADPGAPTAAERLEGSPQAPVPDSERRPGWGAVSVWAEQDSNLRPLPCRGSALTN